MSARAQPMPIDLREELSVCQIAELEVRAYRLGCTPEEAARRILAEVLAPEPHPSHDIDRESPTSALCQVCFCSGADDAIGDPCPRGSRLAEAEQRRVLEGTK